MYRVQVWDDDANRYVDVVLSFDQWGAVGFRHAQLGDTPAEYDDPGEAWRDAVDLQERFGDAIVTLLDMSAGERHFDERNLGSLEKTENKARLAGDALSERAWATARRTLRPSGGSV